MGDDPRGQNGPTERALTLAGAADTPVVPVVTDSSGAHAEFPGAGRVAVPWCPVLAWGIGCFVATRVAYMLATYFGVVYLHNFLIHSWGGFSLGALLRVWQTGDVGWYLGIAAHGYTTPVQTAFFPLYPALIALLGHGLSGTAQLAVAMLIANAFALVALVGLAALAAQEYGPAVAFPALRAMIAFPLAFFLVAAYADTLSLAFIIWCLFLLRRGHWRLAAACAFGATLARPTGVVLALPMLWEFGRQHGWWQRNTWRWLRAPGGPVALLRALWSPRAWLDLGLLLAAVPSAIGIFSLYCWRRFGDPLSFLHVQQSHWLRVPLALPSAVALLVRDLHPAPVLSFLEARTLIDLGPYVLCGMLTVLMLRRMPLAFTLYMLGLLYLDVSEPIVGHLLPFPSVGRHMLLAVPIFLVLGAWSARRPWLDTLVLAAGFILQGIFFAAFLTGNLAHVNAIP